MSDDFIMRPCSGGFEAGDEGALAHLYAWSEEHRCRIGAGCNECHDTGLVRMTIPSEEECQELARLGPPVAHDADCISFFAASPGPCDCSAQYGID